MVKMLDAEFALVLFDKKNDQVMAARDPIGIRPMFYGYQKQSGKIAFCGMMVAVMCPKASRGSVLAALDKKGVS